MSEDSSDIAVKEEEEVVSSEENNEDPEENKKDTEEEIYEIEEIIDFYDTEHEGKKIRFFLVKWLGYPKEEATWEPETNFHSTDCISDFFEKRRQKKKKQPRDEDFNPKDHRGKEEEEDDWDLKDDDYTTTKRSRKLPRVSTPTIRKKASPKKKANNNNRKSPAVANNVQLSAAESEYEKKRQEQIAKNLLMMQQLGIISPIGAEAAGVKKTVPAKRVKKEPVILTPSRKSGRLEGRVSVNLSEDLYWKEMLHSPRPAQPPIPKKIAPLFSPPDPRPVRHASGGRIYDSVTGVTCHQCRQKTIDPKTNCVNESEGGMTHHHFCEMCLRNRYGEELEETLQNPEYLCPYCRGICNCSFCRTRKGKAPTGALYHQAVASGFSSVAEYLDS